MLAPMRERSRTRKNADVNQIAKSVVDAATGATPEPADPDAGKNPAAVALGKLGGKKGGKARWQGVSKRQRSEIARKAVAARWARKQP